MTLQRWCTFVATSAIVLAVPGPTIATMTSYVVTYGRRAVALLVIAVALGDLTAISLSLFGVGAVVATSTTLFNLVKWTGAIYILFLGVERIRGRGATRVTSGDAALSRRRLFSRMFAVTLLNPKGVIFYVAFLPQFVSRQAAASTQLVVLAATFVLLSAANAILFAAGASIVSTRLTSGVPSRFFNVVSGALLIGIGLWAMTTHPNPVSR